MKAISIVPVRVVCGVAQTLSHFVLLVHLDDALLLDAAVIMLVIVPTLLG